MKHTVTLPHPSRGSVSKGVCVCGWFITYSWGGHGLAASSACEHVEKAAEAEPVEARQLSGEITVMEGRSL